MNFTTMICGFSILIITTRFIKNGHKFKMIYFLYGADSYRSREKLREIIGGYREKHGNFLNFSRFDAEDQNLTDLKIAGKMQSLFSPKQMVVIENVFSLSDGNFD